MRLIGVRNNGAPGSPGLAEESLAKVIRRVAEAL
jgi:hypothetical protein